jgi:ribosome-associated protein
VDGDCRSRTQKKIEDRALQKLGERLTTLSPEQLETIDLPDELLEAVLLVGNIKSHGARRRQMQTIGAIMRRIDPEPVRNGLEKIRRQDFSQSSAFKRVEKWRDLLVAGNSDIIEEITRSCPAAERQRLKQLAATARRECGTPKGRKSARLLFRYLRQVSES